MLKINIIAIGKDKDLWITDSCSHYTKLIQKYCKLDIKSIPSPRLSSSLSPQEIKSKEMNLIEKEISKSFTIALTDKGEEHTSHSLSKLLEKWHSRTSEITFLIGGAYGLDDKLIKSSDYKLSLSKLTFSHQLVRPVLLEQLYRAFSIINNTDYHK